MQIFGITLNLITLFALVLSIGIVVDNAIVVVEAVHAKMEEKGLTPVYATEEAMRRVVRSIASLAWASDEALAESAELPTRYDAGPDPYARFAPRTETTKEGGQK